LATLERYFGISLETLLANHGGAEGEAIQLDPIDQAQRWHR
jgi:hypothetical protein